MNATIETVRGFNRFFTRFVGALDPRFLGTDLTLSEARLLFEIATREAPLASDLQAALGMDRAYVSRALGRFEDRGWIVRPRAAGDARRRPIAITPAGRAVFEDLDRRQRGEVVRSLERLGPAQQDSLASALTHAQALLDASAERQFVLRPFRPGDLGIVASRQAILYREVYGWGAEIEAIELEVTAAFLRNFKPGREQCWIAEVDGVLAGSIFLVDEGEGVSRLRLLYVEPFARGLGIGEALVSDCVAFAREAGYREIVLWTHQVLTSARRIYAAHGFQIVETWTHDDFGKAEVSETWRLPLTA
ncbi:MAG: MarR family transcriptional regulator [Caulobacteraceae bacterium]|nr:MarR family transcriptional regulator [Caulobacteraceae bacterium]